MSSSASLLNVKPAQRKNAAIVFAAEGALLILLGMAAIAFPLLASLATAIFLGWILVTGACVVALAAFAGRERRHLGWALVNALAMLLVGLLVLWRPVIGAISLTVVFGVYLLVRSYALWAIAFDQRQRHVRGWWTLLLAAAVDLILAVMLIVIAPFGALLALGIIVGIDLAAGGLMLIALAGSLRRPADAR
jgi:uncharacterized membrane protein HdeD (DUF308 family)